MIYINLKQDKSISKDFIILKEELGSNIQFLIKCTDSILQLNINDSNFTKRNCMSLLDVKLDINNLIENKKILTYNANKSYKIAKDTILDIYFLDLLELDKNLFKEIKILTDLEPKQSEEKIDELSEDGDFTEENKLLDSSKQSEEIKILTPEKRWRKKITQEVLSNE